MHPSPQARLYEESLGPDRSRLFQRVMAARTAVVLCTLLWVALGDSCRASVLPWIIERDCPRWCTDYVVYPLVMILRGCLLLEVVGYTYHRFVHHLGWLTPRAGFARRNQRLHWVHHMAQYPIGTEYERSGEYLSSEGSTLTWLPPYLVTMGAIVALHGLGADGLLLTASLMGYAYFLNLAHVAFHVAGHAAHASVYFRWIADVHRLHHWDQRCNFTITVPVLDILCGTYRAPRHHAAELRQTREGARTASDLINWRYLMLLATTAEQRAFICDASGHPEVLKHMPGVLDVLASRVREQPADLAAQVFFDRTMGCLAETDTDLARATMAGR